MHQLKNIYIKNIKIIFLKFLIIIIKNIYEYLKNDIIIWGKKKNFIYLKKFT